MSEDEGPRILLIGLMGAGKSRVGRALSQRLGVPLLDNDALLEARHGRAKGALLAQIGPVAFAEAEVEVALQIIRTRTPYVGGLPAGVLLDPRVRAALRETDRTVCVWLRAGLETLTARLRKDLQGRPRLDGELEAAIARLAPPREAAFSAVADVVVDVDGQSPEALSEHIASRLQPMAGPPPAPT